MPIYTLELDLFGVYITDMPGFEIWTDGSIEGAPYSISNAGTSISITVNYGGALPSSLELRFDDASGEGGRSIEIRGARINGRNVNSNNFLSTDTLTNGSSSNVDIANSAFLFDASEPAASEFTTGATETFTAGNDTYRRYNDTDDEVFDMLDGRDVAYLGSGNDKVNGGDGNDIIRGGGGDDLIYGGSDNGNDRLLGGTGHDTIYGGGGNDRIQGDDGNDEIHGGDGDDRLSGNDGDDIITGGEGNDSINGGTGTNILFGDAGDDQIISFHNDDSLDGGTGNDSIYAGGGADIIHGGDGDDLLIGDDGDDVIYGEGDNDTINGRADNDTLFGGAGNDIVSGEDGADIIDGGTGDDSLIGGAGADTIDGGTGNDIIHGHGQNLEQIQTILSANPNVFYSSASNSFYQLDLNAYSYTAALAAANGSILGGQAGHLANITSASENALLLANTGFDAWLGGNDTSIEGQWVWQEGAEAGVTFYSGDASGAVTPGSFENWAAGEPNDFGAGEDFMLFRGFSDGLWEDFGGPNNPGATTAALIEWDAGLMNDDNAVDILSGGAGNDQIYGYGGADILNGGDGNDLILGGDGNDVVEAGSGEDSIYGQAGDDIIAGRTGDDIIDGGAGNDTLFGNDQDDQITGGTGVDIINGGDDNDTILLANGDFAVGESIDGGNDTDELILTNATIVDFTTGTLSNLETLTGSDGDDDVTYTIQQALDFTTIDLDGGNDTTRVVVSGTVDVTALGAPTILNTENGFLLGSAGADNITITGAQLDALIFGAGTIDLLGSGDVLNLTSTSADLNTLGDGSDAGIVGVETIDASSAAAGVAIGLIAQTDDFTLIGSDQGDFLLSGSGDDIINGGNGNDNIAARDGVDIVSGGNGNDEFLYFGNSEFDIGESVDGGADNDTILLFDGAGSSDAIDFTRGTITAVENLTGTLFDDDVTMSITQFFGFDAIDYLGGTDAQTIDASGTNDVTALTAPTVSNLESSDIIFSAGVDDLTISGAQLDSFTTGSTSIDTLGGTDVLRLTSTSANLNAFGTGSNADIANLEEIDASAAGSSVIVSMSAQTEAFTITGGASADTLTGGSNNDTIDGGNGDNILTGLDGNDTITGGTGNDTILGGDGDDILTGGAGDDTIYGATIIGESGVETVVQTDSTTWHTVTFAAAILNPVVKMSNMTNNDGDFYVVRVRDLTETGFEWQIDEFDYLDGSRVLAEDVSWIAISEGTHTLDNGSVIQAGRTTATNEAETVVAFNAAFGSAPVVMTQVISDNDSGAVGTRNRNRTATNFRVQMLEEEAADGVHATEDIGWIAIDNGGSVGSGFLIGETGNSVTHNVTTVNFGSAFDNTPVVLHDQQTRDGGDTSYSQADGITTSTARFFIGEEQSANAETNHTTEIVGYYALNEGLLTSAGAGDNEISGGAGLDTLFGGDGADTFIFENPSAFTETDILADFSTGEGDILDISDLIVGTFSGDITEYVFFDDSSTTDTVVQVDRDGTGGAHALQDVTLINGITGLDEATLFANNNIVV